MNILICYGTRPEYIKIKSLLKNSLFKTCFTGQHIDLIDNHIPDYNLNNFNSSSNNRLNDIVLHILSNTQFIKNFSYILVQGDTTSAFAMALSAFNQQIPVIHLEAGLRTYNNLNPFPEEMNRQCISRMANIHLCPTINNSNNLKQEGIITNIFITGNTGLDNICIDNICFLDIILITLHRRDNIPFISDWFIEINKTALIYSKLKFIFPMHPNPKIQMYKYLLTANNINIIEPITHEKTLEILRQCKWVITDSGGISEEASFFGKRIIICRENTERIELLETGHGMLCKTPNKLLEYNNEMYKNYKKSQYIKCPYGDGKSSVKIMEIINNIII